MYANRFELEQCVVDALSYCESSELEHSVNFRRILANAHRDWVNAINVSDKAFIGWKTAEREERLAWKHLAKTVTEIQVMLERVNATGYLDQKVMYWDPPALVPAVDEMIRYLKAELEDIEFAGDQIDLLKRRLSAAQANHRTTLSALAEYKRQARGRSDSMTTLVNTIASFRRAMRREIGKGNAEYQQIRWPYAVASDEAVL